MKTYKLMLKQYEKGEVVYKPVSPTKGEPYLFPTISHVQNAYRSLYYKNTFIGFNDGAKAEEVEVPENTELCTYGS